MTKKRVDTEVTEAIFASKITQPGDGDTHHFLTPPAGLDPRIIAKLDKALKNIGGAPVRSIGAYAFTQDPRELLGLANPRLDTEVLPELEKDDTQGLAPGEGV